MRKVVKDLNDPPAIFKDKKTEAEWELIAKSGDTDKIKDKIYKGSYRDQEGKTQSRVREKLNEIYHGKCAYCETREKGEIEHYRPKKAVKEDKSHKGYYWLCYEWSNLVPSCRYCNTEGGKANQFPISGSRVTKPTFTDNKLNKDHCCAHHSPLIDENAVLLHPEIDDPRLHLEFCWDPHKGGIKIQPKGGSRRGEQTIRICNLNRESLRIDRQEIIVKPIKDYIDQVFRDLLPGDLQSQKLFGELKKLFIPLEENAMDNKNQHTMLRWYITSSAEAFEQIIGPAIENPNQRLIVLEAYKAFKNGALPG